MRQFFKLMAVVALALLVATPAMALDFKFGAEYRVRFYNYVNAGFDDNPGSNPGGVQLRVRPRFDVSDDNGNISATLRLEIGDIEWGNGGGAMGNANGGTYGTANTPGSARTGNGSGGSLGVDGVNVETKWAFIDFASPFGIPLRWRAGLQGWYLPKGFIVDDDAAGLRAYGNYGMVSYDAAWYRASGGQVTNAGLSGTQVYCNVGGTVQVAASATACGSANVLNIQQAAGVTSPTGNTTDNNMDYYQMKMDMAIAKWLNPGLYYIYGRNAASSNAAVAGQQFLGLTVTGDAGFLKYDFDWAMGQQNGGLNGGYANAGRTNVQGWMIDAGVHIPVGPVLFHVVGSYATGDKQNGGKSEAMPWIAGGWNGAGGLYEMIGAAGAFDPVELSQDYPAGLWMLGAGVEYRPVKALWLRLMYGFAGFTESSANCAFNKSAQPGGAGCYGPTYKGKGFTQTASNGQGIGGLAGKSTFGQEIGLRADYDMWTGFKIQGAAGWVIPSGGETVSEYILQLLYNF